MGQVISRQTRVLVIVAAAAVAASTFGVSSATAAKQTSKAAVQKRVIRSRSATPAPSRSGPAKFETQLAPTPGQISTVAPRVAPSNSSDLVWVDGRNVSWSKCPASQLVY